jgi:hypothetical protein
MTYRELLEQAAAFCEERAPDNVPFNAYLGRAIRAYLGQDTEEELLAKLEAQDADLTEIATTMTDYFDSVDLNDLPISLTKGIKALSSREGELVAALNKLDAIQRYVDRLAKGHTSGTWQGLVKGDIERILWPKVPAARAQGKKE